MTIQLVNSENLVEFVKTGKVPDFKPPEAKAEVTEVKAEAKAEVKPDAKPTAEAKPETVRNDKGQFTKPEEGDKTTATAATAGNDDEGGDDLPERARSQIGKKHRLWKEAEEREQRALRRVSEAERRAEEAERKLREVSKSEPAQSQELTAPKPEDFKSVAEYADAVVDFKLKQREAKEREQREADQKAELERTFNSRMVAAREKYTDFDEVLKGISGTDLDQVPKGMIEYIQESELGPDLLHHLAKHPTTLDRIRKLSASRMFAELGKLEDKLGTVENKPEPPAPKQEKQPERQLSKAPAPIAPLDTAGASPVAKKPEEMSVTELREFRRQEALEKRSRA